MMRIAIDELFKINYACKAKSYNHIIAIQPSKPGGAATNKT
jgi:hypothetical protein